MVRNGEYEIKKLRINGQKVRLRVDSELRDGGLYHHLQISGLLPRFTIQMEEDNIIIYFQPHAGNQEDLKFLRNLSKKIKKLLSLAMASIYLRERGNKGELNFIPSKDSEIFYSLTLKNPNNTRTTTYDEKTKIIDN